MYDNATHNETAIIASFFILKNKGLIASPKTEEEEILIDYSYDIKDIDDGKRFLDELQGKDLTDYIYALRSLSSEDRYVFHDRDLYLRSIARNTIYLNAVCKLVTRTLEELN